MFIVSLKLYAVPMGCGTKAIHSHNLAPGCGICAQCGLHHRHWTAVVSDSGSCQWPGWPGVHPSRSIYEHVQITVFGEAFNLHQWKQKNSIRHFIQQRGIHLGYTTLIFQHSSETGDLNHPQVVVHVFHISH